MLLFELIKDAIRRLRGLFAGQRVLLIGPSKAGKTTFKLFVTTGQISSTHEQTFETEVDGISSGFLSDLPENWAKVVDTVGAHGSQDAWFDEVKDCDVVLYFVDASRFLNDLDQQYSKRVNLDSKILHGCLSGKSPRCFVVVTHIDLCTGDSVQELVRGYDFLRLKGALGGTDKVPHILGSLAKRESALELIAKLGDNW